MRIKLPMLISLLSRVRLRNEELQKLNTFLKAENEALRNGDSPRSTSSGNIRRVKHSLLVIYHNNYLCFKRLVNQVDRLLNSKR